MDYIVLAVLQEWNVGHHIHRLNPGMPGEINMTCHMRFFFFFALMNILELQIQLVRIFQL
jgi:hypothetical protein